jgi:hypothetical protein
MDLNERHEKEPLRPEGLAFLSLGVPAMHDPSSALTVWSNFYVITGSSAAALTGLMFVVITLVVSRRMPGTERGISTFSTPTVVHFSAALLISAILTVPWRSLVHAGLVLGLTGVGGVVYALLVMHRTRKIGTDYRPDLYDWLWYGVLPLVAYATLVAGAAYLPAFPIGAPFAVAAAAMALIFIGIHNAWDVVTFLAVRELQNSDDTAEPSANEKHDAEPAP